MKSLKKFINDVYEKFCLSLAENNLESLLDQALSDKNVLQFQKRRISLILILLPLIIFNIIMIGSVQIILVSVFLIVGLYFYPLYNLKNQTKYLALKNDILFPNYVKILITLLRTNTVYNSFSESMMYVNPHMQRLIKKLLIQIDQDNGIEPYLNFAKNFNSINATNIMTMIYYYNQESGNTDYLSTITKTNEKLKNNQLKELVEKKANQLDKYTSYVFMLNIAQVGCFVIFILMSAFSVLFNL